MQLNYELMELKIKELEIIARENPSKYKFKIFCLTILGFGFIWAVLLAAIALSLLTVYIILKTRHAGGIIKLLFLLLGFIFLILRSLWVNFPVPSGIELKRSDSKKLFDIVEKIRIDMKTSKIHHIIITDEFNASIIQRPLLGYFGIYRNYLEIGLPLMMAVSEEQLISVIAHEMGHMSKNHGRFGSWIYRVRQTWFSLMDSIEENDGKGLFIFKPFFNWFMPLYWAYTFVLARENEYEADAASVKQVGSQNAVNALITVNITGSYVEEKFWPYIYEKANYQSQPQNDVYFEMKHKLNEGIDSKNAKLWLERALKIENTYNDIHPSMSERIKSMGGKAIIPEKTMVSAAEVLLENKLNEIAEAFSSFWKDIVEDSWKERNDYINTSRKRLIQIENKERNQELSLDEMWEMAYLTEEIKGKEDALPIYKKLLIKNPNHIPCSFDLGRLLLDKNDESGIELVEKAMAEEEEYVMEGCSLIYNYYIDNGDIVKAKKYDEMSKKFEVKLKEAEEERSKLLFNDKYISHGLPEEQVASIARQLKEFPEIKTVYLVQKEVTHFKNKPLYVLGILIDISPFCINPKKKYIETVDTLAKEIEFSGETFVVHLHEDNRPLKKIIEKIPGSKIYSRKNK